MNTSAKKTELNINSGSLAHIAKDVQISITDEPKLAWEKRDKWQQKANGFRITLHYQRRRMSLDFWQGVGIHGAPTATGVLECILADAQGSNNNSFKDWCAEYGYDTDSRQAEKTYKLCKKNTKRLEKLLGADFNRFMIAERD